MDKRVQTALTRRQFGAGAATTLIATHLPLPAFATPSFRITDLDDDLQYNVNALIDTYRAYQRAERRYGQRSYGPLVWGDRYGDLLEAHQDLAEYWSDDSATAAKIGAWANTLVHPVCLQARAFWMPITDLSPEFAQLHPALIEARKIHALARYRFWTAFPSGHWLHDADEAEFEVRIRIMERAADKWFALRRQSQTTLARTSGDRALARRVIESIVTDQTIDVPYLKSVLPDWQPFSGEWPELRRCALACADCEALLGRRVQFDFDTDDEVS